MDEEEEEGKLHHQFVEQQRSNTAPTNQGPSSLVRQPTLYPCVAFARVVDRVRFYQ